MVILRQKQFGWFGFGKKNPSNSYSNYDWPKFEDLPGNLKQALKGVQRVKQNTLTQKLLNELGEFAGVKGEDIFKVYINTKDVEEKQKLIFSSSDIERLSPNIKLYPLMNNAQFPNCRDILFYDINLKHFYDLDIDTLDIEDVDDYVKNLRDYIKGDLDYTVSDFSTELDEDYWDDYENLLKQIRKAFWV
jgi:hypothetical protein